MKNTSNKIIVMLGPTSSGKSDVAIRLAKKFDGEIISADSRQIYKGLDIGTGKIEADNFFPHPLTPSPLGRGWVERKRKPGEGKNKIFYSKGIPHYLINIANPTANYNVTNFKKDAEKIIADILKRGKLPIICGGTGFWIKAVVDNINFPEVKPDWKLRNKLSNKSTKALFKTLSKLDHERAKNIDAKNKVRLIRAIEICKAIKKVPPLPSGEDVRRTGEGKKYNFLQIGISLPKEKLYTNIKKRLQKRFTAGMIEEVADLKKSGLSWKKIQSFGLGYSWIPLYLQNLEKFQNFRKEKIPTKNCYRNKLLVNNIIKLPKTKKELFEKVLQAEKNYAKRQMTWFSAQGRSASGGKKDKRIKWLENYKKIKKEVKDFLNK